MFGVELPSDDEGFDDPVLPSDDDGNCVEQPQQKKRRSCMFPGPARLDLLSVSQVPQRVPYL